MERREELLRLLEQEDRERVTPKLEGFRKPCRIKIARGGRGAGAKSWSCASLLIQRCHRETLRLACFREIQKSLRESSYDLFVQTISRLGYRGWKITNEYLESPTGSLIVFRGLKDLRASDQVKSMESFDVFFLEEAATISDESIKTLLPTLRKAGSELWAVYNPQTGFEPITVRLWNSDRQDLVRIELRQGREDNPFWTDALQRELEESYRQDTDEALHIWGGQPRAQAQNAILNRVVITEAMHRQVAEEEPDEVGVDVARFGDDTTQLYRRRGCMVVDHREYRKADTQCIAEAAYDFADRNPQIPIKVDDTGVGGGVTDRLRVLGARVIPIQFGGKAKDGKKYDTVIDEMWFAFASLADRVGLPDDYDLLGELTGRLYGYDKQGRRKVEPKGEFKKRYGHSPDKADALLLAFYNPERVGFYDQDQTKEKISAAKEKKYRYPVERH